MNIIKAIKARTSTRAFLDKPVILTDVNLILEAARFAPSGTNIQPWHVAVVTGKTKSLISENLLQAFRVGEAKRADYAYYPEGALPTAYQDRRFSCGMALYQALGIARENKVARKEAWENNYRAFNAPVMLFFFMDACLEKGSYLDYGMFLQNIMLAALDFGLATCPQAALAEYPDLVKAQLNEFYHDKILIAGMALGYPDLNAAVNQYRTERESVSQFTQWFE